MKIVIGFGIGGTYGNYAQMFADHLKKYIAGDPTIIVESRPSAGGLKALNYVGNPMQAMDKTTSSRPILWRSSS